LQIAFLQPITRNTSIPPHENNDAFLFALVTFASAATPPNDAPSLALRRKTVTPSSIVGGSARNALVQRPVLRGGPTESFLH
jgi:hypothetical protein